MNDIKTCKNSTKLKISYDHPAEIARHTLSLPKRSFSQSHIFEEKLPNFDLVTRELVPTKILLVDCQFAARIFS